jgi:hypothetical protein
MWNLVLVDLEIVLLSVQDRCRFVLNKTILDAHDGTPR